MYSENFISKKLKKFAHRNDWLISGEYIYGEESGFLFTGMDSRKQKTFITPVPGITSDQEAELIKILEKNKSTMRLSEFEITDDFLSIRIEDSVSLKAEDIDFILALLTGALQEVDIVAENRCQECKKTDASSTNFIYDLYCYLHDDCAKIYEDEVIDKSPKKDREETPENEISSGEISEQFFVPGWKKIIYTLAGGILGSIPWLLLPFVMDLVNDILENFTTSDFPSNAVRSVLICVCAYLIPYFAITGYKLSGAKMTGQGRWITGIISIVVVILTQFTHLGVLIIKEPGVDLNFSNYMTNIVKFDFYTSMLLGAVIGIVFTLISVLPFFDSKKSVAGKKDETESDEEDSEDNGDV